ncbi:glycosyltransferase family 4 protein [Mesoflavibacter sp. CH_XMU1422-2]|uniref:glycosyltransferase family 4 protein n=1 Tax=Mesoflavibacter sp. CH_XMU1422-2 TaxID=3107770 RepID=UPI0030090E87
MPNIFLESHNIKNLNFGFGQFNYHLIQGIYKQNPKDFKITLHAKNINKLESEFGDFFDYKKYYSFRRYKSFAIRKKFNLWHSLNQNLKIEPYHNIPYLLTVHDVNFIDEVSSKLDHPRNIRFQEKLNRSHAITYISNFSKTSTHKHFKVPNVPEYVIYNGNTIKQIIDFKDYKPQIVFRKPFLFSIGEFTIRKNFHSLIEMLNFLPDYNLILSGNNNTAYTKEIILPLIKKYKLNKRVIITGKISEKDKQYYMSHCQAFVFPSLREGFGIPPIEAMRFGKPVFLSNLTSLPEIGGKHAFYWDNYDPEYMANIVKNGLSFFKLNKTELQKKYITHAKSFNWDNAAKAYIEVYQSLLK